MPELSKDHHLNYRNAVRYLVSIAATISALVILEPIRTHLSLTTVALLLILKVFFIAILAGGRPAALAAVIAMLGFNYLFIPPVRTLTVADPENWVGLFAFLVVALVTGHLSAGLKRRAEEAEADRKTISSLYEDLNSAFDQASKAAGLEQSEKLKSALLDAVTHDIRTPLTAIKASATVLLNDFRSLHNSVRIPDELKYEMLTTIDREADRLDNFVEGMIELAKIEAGKMPLAHRWIEMDEIIETAMQRLELGNRSISVSIESDLPSVFVDPRTLTEVVYNLLDNALKYSSEAIRLQVRRADPANLLCAVEDNGPGIRPESKARIFDKFFREAASSIKGNGIGLAIAKGLVESHGGRIWIEDTVPTGCRFLFTIPVGDEEEGEKNEY